MYRLHRIALYSATCALLATPVLAEEPAAPSAPAPEAAAASTPAKKAPGPKRNPLVQVFDQADTNKDKQLSYDEVKALRPNFPKESFTRWDKNSDGMVSRDELPPAGAAPQAGKPQAGPGNVLRAADTDKDGKITEAEFKAKFPEAPADRFKQLDKNGDGVLSPADRPAGGQQPGAGEFAKRIQAADKNADGNIDKAEFTVAFPKAPESRFTQLDKDSDGVVSKAELQAAAAAMAQRAKAQPAAAKDAGPDWNAVRTELISKYDADKDGKLSFEELSAGKPGFPRRSFDRMDGDSDGVLSAADAEAPAKKMAGDKKEKPAKPAAAPAETPMAEEKPAAESAPVAAKPAKKRQGPSLAEQIAKGDKDGDQKLSFQEAVALNPKMTEDRFDKRDKNGDGFISKADKKKATP